MKPDVMQGPQGLPDVILVEEGLREGLQIENPRIPVADKIHLLDELSWTGLKRIVVGSFVSPKWTPQMAEIDTIVQGFSPNPDVVYTALALNKTGVERRAAYVPVPLSLDDNRPSTRLHLCDVFAQRNTNRTRQAEIDSWAETADRAVESGAAEAEIGVNAAWGSNWLGPFDLDERIEFLEQQHRVWESRGIRVTKVFLGDPMGWNTPNAVARDIKAILERWPQITTFHLHLHNTRGCAPVSIYAALEALGAGRRAVVDTSIGGMAGCPYCGNGRAATLSPTEDIVHLLEGMGYRTGIDMDRLIDVVVLAERIVGHSLYGHVSKSGPLPLAHERRYPMDLPFIETLAQAQHFRLGGDAYAGPIRPWRTPITSIYRPD